MILVDKKGNQVGVLHYSDGRDIRVGDIVKGDKFLFRVTHRVWETSVGEITSLLVEKVGIDDLYE